MVGLRQKDGRTCAKVRSCFTPQREQETGRKLFSLWSFFFFQILLLLFFFKKGKCHPTVGGFLCFQVQAHAFCQL